MSEKQPDRIEVQRLEDASSLLAESLGPQIGSDGTTLSEQKIDRMRLSRLNLLEIMGVMYFKGHKNKWIKDRMDDYLDLKMSFEGHERSKLIVEALKAVGGSKEAKKKKKDDRGWVGRNLTKRGQGPDDEE